MRRIVALLGGVGMLLTLAGPTLAATPPTRQVTEYRPFVEADRFNCGTFTLDGVWNADLLLITYYDDSGQPYFVRGYEHFQGTLTNSVTGKTISDKGEYNYSYDLANLDLWLSGTRIDTAPGWGIVLNDSGHIVDDPSGAEIFRAGPTDIDGGQYYDQFVTGICTYMATP